MVAIASAKAGEERARIMVACDGGFSLGAIISINSYAVIFPRARSKLRRSS